MIKFVKWFIFLMCLHGCNSTTAPLDSNNKSVTDDSTHIGNNAQSSFKKPVVPHNYQIEPGRRVGEIKYTTSLNAFSEIFPNQKIDEKEVYIEGKLEPEWHHFVDGLEIVWEDQSTLMHPIKVILDSKNLIGRESKYSIEGITLGSTIKYIEFVNEGSFLLQRSEPGSSIWIVTNWNKGQLQKYSDVIAIELTNDSYIPRLEEAKTINSSEAWVKNTDLKVSKIIIKLIDNPEDRKAKVFPSLPETIQSYLLTHRDYFCYNPVHDEFDFKKMNLNDDNFPEYIIWFVGCPASRGKGTLFIFNGKNANEVIAEYNGYEVTGPLSITRKAGTSNKFSDILIGDPQGDGTYKTNTIWLKFNLNKNRYEEYLSGN